MKNTFLSILMLGVLAGCISPKATDDMPVEREFITSDKRFHKVYLLAPGDKMDVLVSQNPTASRGNLIIRPDGYISLPYIRDVKAAGKTVEELRKSLEEKYSKRLVDPEVAVIPTVVREPMVYVLGEVMVPQPVPLRSARSAAQAITFAGGFKPTAKKNYVALIRLEDTGHLSARRLQRAVKGQPAPYMKLETTLLQPDDIIMVPEKSITQINQHIDNFVNKPLQGINSVVSPIASTLLTIRLIESDDF